MVSKCLTFVPRFMQFFVDDCNRRLRDKLEQHHTDLQALRTTERLRTAIRWRLEMLIPYMGEISFQGLESDVKIPDSRPQNQQYFCLVEHWS